MKLELTGIENDRWRLSLVTETPRVLYPTTRNLDEGLKNDNFVAMSKKACEEATETLEAAVMYQLDSTEENAHALAQENIDAIQMHLNMLNYLEKQGTITISEDIKEHNRKMYIRGWEWDTSLKLEIKEVLK